MSASHSRDFLEGDLIGLVLLELSRSAEHVPDGARGERVLPLHDELVVIGGAQLDVGGVRPLAAAVLRVLVLPAPGSGQGWGRGRGPGRVEVRTAESR